MAEMSEIEKDQPGYEHGCEGHPVVIPPQIWEYCQTRAKENDSSALHELGHIIEGGVILAKLRSKGFPVTVHLPSGDKSIDNIFKD